MDGTASYKRKTRNIVVFMLLGGFVLWSLLFVNSINGVFLWDEGVGDEPQRYSELIIPEEKKDTSEAGPPPHGATKVYKSSPAEQTDKYLEQFVRSEGTIVCTIPDTMRVGDFYRVVVQVKKGVEINIEKVFDDLAASVPASSKEEVIGNTSIDTVAITSYVQARLVDARQNFKVNPLFSNPLRLVDSLAFTTWEWEVSPLSASDSPLIINVSTLIKEGEKEDRYKEYKVFEKSVTVRANHGLAVLNFATARWEWLFATFISPFFVWLWRNHLKHRFERKKEE